MADLPQLFVSHSSLDVDLTRQVCALLKAEHGRPGYDVLVDYTELKPGVDWPHHLHEYMARCNAAVLLLTPHAARSPWVLKEATILEWRRSLDPSFQLFPVRLHGLDEATLTKEKFGPLMLSLIQQIGSDDPDTIADAVRAGVGQPNLQDPTPYERLLGRLTDLLHKAGSKTLKEIAEKVSVEHPPWRPGKDLQAQYVAHIAGRILTEDLGGFDGVDKLIDALSFTPAPDNVKQVFHLIAPYWVDAQAAGRLPLLRQVKERRAAALNGVLTAKFTAKAYVRRAHPVSLNYTVIPIPGGASGALLGHVEEQICTWMRENEGEVGTNEEVVAELAMRESTYYAVLPGPVDDRSLTEIVDRFPTITFILCPGPAFDYNPPMTRVEWLEPPLQLVKEKRAFSSCNAAEKILRRMESASM